MSEHDLPERLARYGGSALFQRVALTHDDITATGLPSFSAHTKRKDSRYPWFVEHHGDECWELDALSPVTLRTRVEAAIRAHLDLPRWERYARVEQAEHHSLTTFLHDWARAHQPDPRDEDDDSEAAIDESLFLL